MADMGVLDETRPADAGPLPALPSGFLAEALLVEMLEGCLDQVGGATALLGVGVPRAGNEASD